MKFLELELLSDRIRELSSDRKRIFYDKIDAFDSDILINFSAIRKYRRIPDSPRTTKTNSYQSPQINMLQMPKDVQEAGNPG